MNQLKISTINIKAKLKPPEVKVPLLSKAMGSVKSPPEKLKNIVLNQLTCINISIGKH